MASSIFSSEAFRSYGRLPAGEKAWHGALTASFAALLVLANWLPVRVYGRFGIRGESFRTLAVAALSPQTQVLCLGTSETTDGLWPEKLSVPAVSLATPGCSYTWCESLVRKHLPHLPGLRVAVVELDNVTSAANPWTLRHAVTDLLELGVHPAEVQGMSLAERCTALTRAALHGWLMLPRLTPFELTLRKTPSLPDDRRDAEGRPVVTPGFIYIDHRRNDREWERARKLPASLRARRVVQANRLALVRTLRILRRRGILVLLTVPPKHPDAWARYAETCTLQLPELKDMVRKELGSDPGVVIRDFGRAPGLVPADFYDYGHLNVHGARKYTRLIDTELKRLLAKQ